MILNKSNKFLLLFIVICFLLICYGSFIDYSNFTSFSLKNLLGLGLSFSASCLGIIFVFLEVKERYSMFIVGIIGSFFSTLYLYFWSPLLWDMAISMVYIILNCYGLYYWKYSHQLEHNKKSVITTKTLTIKQYFLYTIIGFIGILLLSYIGIVWGKYSSPLQAFTDATTTVIAILGQWFLSKKYLEMWYMWILVNAISIPLYISIQAYVYVMVYICYLIISFYGLVTWKKNMLLPQK